MLDKIKLALRISHSLLDDDIKDTIATARMELIRSGIAETKANSDTDNLITTAIKTYCQYAYASDSKLAEGYYKSFLYQQDNLRKSKGYRKESDADV